MPSRVIRGEIVSSESLARVSIGADLTFRSLIVAVDDYGRIDGRLLVLKAALYPLRQEVTLDMIEGWLVELAAGEDAPIVRYVVDGRPWIQLAKWEKHRGKSKRGGVSKCPEPPEPRFPRRPEEDNGVPRISGDAQNDFRGSPPVSRGSGVGSRESGSVRAGEAPAEAPAALAQPEVPSAPSILLNVISTYEGEPDEKSAWLADEWPLIHAEAQADPNPKRLPAIAIRYYRRYLQGPRPFRGIAERQETLRRMAEHEAEFAADMARLEAEEGHAAAHR